MTYKLVMDEKAVETKLKKNRTVVKDFLEDYLRQMALYVIASSPVDTGTYITNHEIIVGQASGKRSESSHGKPRKQPYQPFAERGIANLFRDIDALPEGANPISIRNNSFHAPYVEQEYNVYAKARREARRIAQGVKKS